MILLYIVLIVLVVTVCFVIPLVNEIKAENKVWRNITMEQIVKTNDYERIMTRVSRIREIYKHKTLEQCVDMAITIELPKEKSVQFYSLFGVTQKEFVQYIVNEINKKERGK